MTQGGFDEVHTLPGIQSPGPGKTGRQGPPGRGMEEGRQEPEIGFGRDIGQEDVVSRRFRQCRHRGDGVTPLPWGRLNHLLHLGTAAVACHPPIPFVRRVFLEQGGRRLPQLPPCQQIVVRRLGIAHQGRGDGLGGLIEGGAQIPGLL